MAVRIGTTPITKSGKRTQIGKIGVVVAAQTGRIGKIGTAQITEIGTAHIGVIAAQVGVRRTAIITATRVGGGSTRMPQLRARLTQSGLPA